MIEYKIGWKAWHGYGPREAPSTGGESTVVVHSDIDGRVQRASAMTRLDDHLRLHNPEYNRSSSTSRWFIRAVAS